jgi:tRNA U55 pseudouridine synthase TruB
MSFFINYNVEDILKQATESTLRYERGTYVRTLASSTLTYIYIYIGRLSKARRTRVFLIMNAPTLD